MALAIAPHANAAGDAAAGEKIFNRVCKACHDVAGKNKVGPHLDGVVGRQAGSVEGFKYSEAMKSSGVTWDDANLDKYLANPRDFIPKNRMAFAGLKKEDERASVIAFLAQGSS
jgi:cytochrome c